MSRSARFSGVRKQEARFAASAFPSSLLLGGVWTVHRSPRERDCGRKSAASYIAWNPGGLGRSEAGQLGFLLYDAKAAAHAPALQKIAQTADSLVESESGFEGLVERRRYWDLGLLRFQPLKAKWIWATGPFRGWSRRPTKHKPSPVQPLRN